MTKLQDDLSPREIIEQALAKHPKPEELHSYTPLKKRGTTKAACKCGWSGVDWKATAKFAEKEWKDHYVEVLQKPNALLAHEYVDASELGRGYISSCTCGWEGPARHSHLAAKADWNNHRGKWK